MGPVVQHYAFDRGPLLHPLSGHLRARHRIYSGYRGSTEETRMQDLYEWVVITGCVDHDANNALRWGVSRYLPHGAKDTREMFVAIRALRDGYDILVEQIPLWILAKLTWAPRKHAAGESHLFWQASGAGEPMATHLSDVDLRFEGGELRISDAYLRTPEVYEQVANLFMSLCKFQKFADARFATLGPSCRVLLVTLLLGITDAVAWMLLQEGVKQWYLKRFQRLLPELWLLLEILLA